MHELVLSGVFLFALGVALLVAERKPIAGALVLLVGAGWPATLLGAPRRLAHGRRDPRSPRSSCSRGSATRRLPALALPAAVLVVAAAVAVGSATAARHGLVHWQRWDLAPRASGRGVGFVWDAQYGGLNWSREAHDRPRGEVAREPPLYWRAAVLDDFSAIAWREALPRPTRLARAAGRAAATRDAPGRDRGALADTHLVGGSVPIRFDAGERAARHARAAVRVPAVRAHARLPLHGLELRAAADRGRSSPLAAGLSVRSSQTEGLLDVGPA